MKATPEETMKESLRFADRRLPLDTKLEEAQHLLYRMLEEKGYTITRVHLAWAIVSKPAVDRKTVVQLEVDPDGSNLDIILLSDTTDDIEGGFPLGGSWACKSTVKLTYDNIRFACERIESFFGVVVAGNEHSASNWESVQRHLKFEEMVRENNKKSTNV